MSSLTQLYSDEFLCDFLKEIIRDKFINKVGNIFHSKNVGIESAIIGNSNIELIFDCDDITLHGILINKLNNDLKKVINFTHTINKKKVSTNNERLNHTMNTQKIMIIVKKNTLINYIKTGVEIQFSKIERFIFILVLLLFVFLTILYLHWKNYKT